MRLCTPVFCLLALLGGVVPAGLSAAEALVAVAANFADAANRLAAGFAAMGGHQVVVTTGSTGKVYAQIRHGAPYDVFLSADTERPRLLEQDGLAVPGSRFTYAEGMLALIRADGGPVAFGMIQDGSFQKLALANPRLAPYGLAAEQALRSQGLWQTVQERLVFGENVGQAYALVATGNADLGFVALSQVLTTNHWPVPPAWHEPIAQDAVLLNRAVANEAAIAFLAFLRTDAARQIIRDFGYRTP